MNVLWLIPILIKIYFILSNLYINNQVARTMTTKESQQTKSKLD